MDRRGKTAVIGLIISWIFLGNYGYNSHSAEGLTEKRNGSQCYKKRRRGQAVSQEVKYQTERQDHLGIVAGSLPR